MLVLGIDTSCDETAAAVVEDGRVMRSNVVSSQIPLHARFGGVVPEIACRAHTENVTGVIRRALDDAGIGFADLDGVAVTNRPGLIGALLVGLSAAKAVALAHDLPLVGVNHIEAHVFSSVLSGEEVPLPTVALVVSGGHTSLFVVRDVGEMEEIGKTMDDAAGEAFDKAAAVLGLGYPGGPAIQKAAETGDRNAVPFKRPYLSKDSLDFSFSGIKTSLLYRARGQNRRRGDGDLRDDIHVPDMAASFQETVVAVLVRKAMTAAETTGIRHVVLGGGVTANARLRERIAEEAASRGIGLTLPPPAFCTDNAAMVAVVGSRRLAAGARDSLDLDAFSRMT
ncbi:MAG: tRNA (adenosine(37)-N6)-threonylcarbamoyltransferase complex transferase subunit TsaD [Planctomycetota bacterium]